MSRPSRQVFISHASEDLDELEMFLHPLQYLPLDRYVAVNKQQVGWLPETIQKELEASDVIVPFLTKDSMDNRWVNQEIGYAMARNIPVIPVFETSDAMSGLIENVEGVPIDRSEPPDTTYGVISRLREIFAPLSEVMADWYLEILCIECGEFNIFPISQSQEGLKHKHDSGDLIDRTCSKCRTRYRFDPLSLHLVSVGSTDD